MHNVLAILLLIGGLASVLASIPQLIKLLKIKQSDEFNIFSWVIWLLYQVIAVAYTLDIKAYVYAVINLLWVLFYLTMVILILRYRKFA